MQPLADSQALNQPLSETDSHTRRAALQRRIRAAPEDWSAWIRLVAFEFEMKTPSNSVPILLQAQPLHAHRFYFWQLLLLALGRIGDTRGVIAVAETLLSPRFQTSAWFEAMSDADKADFFAHLPLVDSARIFQLFGHEECSNRQLLEALAAFDRRFFAETRPPSTIYPNDPDPDRPLRLGLVANEWHSHAFAISQLPLLRAYNAQAFELVAYDDGPPTAVPAAEQVTRQAPFEAVRLCYGWDAYTFYHQVQLDRIDILIDLSAHINPARLPSLALRPAPIQLGASFNPPFTSGLSCMDYHFSDDYLHPPELHALYAETLLPLQANGYWHPPAPEPLTPLPLLSSGVPTFGVIASPNKYSERALGLWAGVLADHPRSRLMLKDNLFEDPGFGERLRQRFAAAGGDADRLVLCDNRRSFSHYPFLAELDILLDTSPSPGGLSSCDALWTGVPVLSMAGERMLPTLIHSALGTSEWLLAEDATDYRRKALALTGDSAKLQALRLSLRERLLSSPICDLAGQLRQREAHYRAIWQKWCAGQQR